MRRKSRGRRLVVDDQRNMHMCLLQPHVQPFLGYRITLRWRERQGCWPGFVVPIVLGQSQNRILGLRDAYMTGACSSLQCMMTRVCTSFFRCVSESNPRHESVPCHCVREVVALGPGTGGLVSVATDGCGVCCGNRFFCSTNFSICLTMSCVTCGGAGGCVGALAVTVWLAASAGGGRPDPVCASVLIGVANG